MTCFAMKRKSRSMTNCMLAASRKVLRVRLSKWPADAEAISFLTRRSWIIFNTPLRGALFSTRSESIAYLTGIRPFTA